MPFRGSGLRTHSDLLALTTVLRQALPLGYIPQLIVNYTVNSLATAHFNSHIVPPSSYLLKAVRSCFIVLPILATEALAPTKATIIRIPVTHHTFN